MSETKNSTSENRIWDFQIVRDLRKCAKLNLEELSEKSGVSISVISKLERNQGNVEMETLYRIAKVFGMTLSDLIALAENRISHCVNEEQYDSGQFHFHRVTYGNLRCMMATAPKGATISTPEIHRDDYELCWVLAGKLRITLPKETHVLETGMSIQFDALMHHTYEALEDVKLLLLHLRKGKRF